ncbi:MAG: lysylphosphatidylglycerol synthase domain-containing protein [Burkholderiaceae bacterium]
MKSVWWVRVAVVLLTAVLLVWIVRIIDLHAMGRIVAEVDSRTIVGVVAALLISYLFRAMRLYEELRSQWPVRLRDCLRIILLHNMSVNIMPFRAGEAALPLLMARELRIPLHRGLVTLAWLRIQDASIVAVIALIAWPDFEWPLRVFGIVALVTVLAAVLRWAHAPQRSAVTEGRWRDALARATASPWRTWLWCAANWALKLTAIAWLLHDLTSMSLEASSIAALGGEAAAFLPVQGMAGFGTYEAGVALGAKASMQASSASLATLLSAALATHVLVIASSVVAGALALLLPRGTLAASAASSTP